MAPASLTEARPRFVLGQAIVKLKDSSQDRLRGTLPTVRGYRSRLVKSLSSGASLVSLEPEHRLTAPTLAEEEADTLAAIAELKKNPDVEYAHVDLYLDYFATPTDPLYPQQWNHTAINLPTAWNTTTGNGTVTIAVLDTGRLDHPDLAGRWTPTGYDFGDNDADPYDSYTYHHGLHVAGILAARANNGQGGAGVCWNCQLMPVKVSDSALAPRLSAVDEAIRWAADHGARVINMSFGAGYNRRTPKETYPCIEYPDIQNAVTYAVQKGVVVVAAAGNDAEVGYLAENVTPASCDGVIAVGATNRSGARSLFSNGGSRVDVMAPGGDGSNTTLFGAGVGCPVDTYSHPGDNYVGTDNVLSTWALWQSGPLLQPSEYCHRYLGGTSMATPHVAGVAALLLSQKPSMTPAEVTARLKSTATPMSGCGMNCGAGRLNAGTAIYTNLPPRPSKGPWWNPARSGNGLDIQHLAVDQLYVTWFTYTSAGVPIWYQAYLAPESGQWRGDLLRTSWNGSSASVSTVGTMRLTYNSGTGAWRFYWTLGSLSGNEPIERLTFGSGASVMNLTGSWFNAAQSGWGLNFNTQGNTHVANLTVYKGSTPVWLQGVVTSTSTSLSFAMNYVTGTNLCPGCTGTPSVSVTPAGTFTVNGSAGVPNVMSASSSVSFPGGTWNRPPFTLSRLTGP